MLFLNLAPSSNHDNQPDASNCKETSTFSFKFFYFLIKVFVYCNIYSVKKKKERFFRDLN